MLHFSGVTQCNLDFQVNFFIKIDKIFIRYNINLPQFQKAIIIQKFSPKKKKNYNSKVSDDR